MADKHGLEMSKFFDGQNPYARQRLLARLLEVDRQGIHQFSREERAKLVGHYIASVNAHGVDCSSNTCGNLQLNQHVASAAALVPGLGNVALRKFGAVLAQATHWSDQQFRSFPAPIRAGMAGAVAPRLSPGVSRAHRAEPPSGRPMVTGYKMEERVWNLGKAVTSPSQPGFLYLLSIGFIGIGAAREARRLD
ncbi:MAG: hypothetical protein ABSE56_21275 [Bryobacteraceae bacterium]